MPISLWISAEEIIGWDAQHSAQIKKPEFRTKLWKTWLNKTS